MIRFTGYGVIVEKPRVGHLGQIFLCTQEKLCVGSKKDRPFLMVSMCFIILQSFGKIVQRAPAVGAKIWRFFSLSRSVSGRLFVRVSPYWKLRFPVLILRHLNLKDYSSNFIDNCKICSIEVLVNDNNEIINSAKFCCRYNDLYRRRSFGTQGRILNSMGT